MPSLLVRMDDEDSINSSKLLDDDDHDIAADGGDDDENLLNESGMHSPRTATSSMVSTSRFSKGCFQAVERCLKSETFRQMTLGYDYAAQMMISVLWAYIVPLAGYPKKGCPGDPDLCWDQWVVLLLGYSLACTFLVPLLSIAAVKHCSSRVHEMGRRQSFVRRKFYTRGLALFGAALQTTWSVAQSQLLYYVVGQFALTGFGDGHGDDDDYIGPHPPIQLDDDDDDDLVGGRNSSTTSNVTHIGGGGGGRRLSRRRLARVSRGLRFGVRQLQNGGHDGENSHRDTHISHPFDQQADTRSEAIYGAAASFACGVCIFLVAVACISSISAVCQCSSWAFERCGCRFFQNSAYLIELSLLLMNNWYYVLGYSWEMFWSYIWFTSLQTSVIGSDDDDDDDDNGDALAMAAYLFGCDLARAALYTAVFSYFALNWLPLDIHLDMDPSSLATASRVRLLVFRSTAVLVVVALADVPTSFVTVFLAEWLALDGGQQLALLYAFALAGLAGLTHADWRLSLVAPPTRRTLYWREVSQWLVAFLVWNPWLMTVRRTVDWLLNHLLDHADFPWAVIVIVLVLVGGLVTSGLIFISGLLHSLSDNGRQLMMRGIQRHRGTLIGRLFNQQQRHQGRHRDGSSLSLRKSVDEGDFLATSALHGGHLGLGEEAGSSSGSGGGGGGGRRIEHDPDEEGGWDSGGPSSSSPGSRDDGSDGCGGDGDVSGGGSLPTSPGGTLFGGGTLSEQLQGAYGGGRGSGGGLGGGGGSGGEGGYHLFQEGAKDRHGGTFTEEGDDAVDDSEAGGLNPSGGGGSGGGGGGGGGDGIDNSAHEEEAGTPPRSSNGSPFLTGTARLRSLSRSSSNDD